ncbi:MAG: hypothetical protein EBZ47_06180 [Chlamydiae bacterium]|nr:hypothetical protein [Chlamydiota bacterium]
MKARHLLSVFGFCLYANSLSATDYCFVDKKHHWHFESDFAAMSNASFYRPSSVDNTQMQYAEGTSSLYYNHFVSENNAIVAQAGLNYTHVGWDKNPAFSGENYYYGIFSVSLVSYAIERWRWIVNGGISFDITEWNVGQSGVYYALLWGRYQYTQNFAFHSGFFGYVSSNARNGYMLPILGCDWWWTKSWEFKLVFPLETSVNYHFTRNWSSSLMFTTFGGPYRFPRRMHEGIGVYEDGIFEIYSNGVELDLRYATIGCLRAGVGGGYNFGGWMEMKDSNNHHKQYYKFDASGYGRAYLNFTF